MLSSKTNALLTHTLASFWRKQSCLLLHSPKHGLMSTNKTFINSQNIHHLTYQFRKNKKGGGVSLYIADYLPFKCRHYLEYFDSEMESLFIEIEDEMFNLECSLIIGVLYRMPNACVDVFNERMCDILYTVQKERKICYFLGNLNIYLLKYENHKPTATFLENLWTYSVYPLITKPTRITNGSATLIDHVLTNNFDVNSKHMQGILCTSISDHYAIFHVAGNAENDSCGGDITPVLQRNYCQRNINKFMNEVKESEWSGVTEMEYAQLAYSAFHKLLPENIPHVFLLRKLPSGIVTINRGWQQAWKNL